MIPLDSLSAESGGGLGQLGREGVWGWGVVRNALWCVEAVELGRLDYSPIRIIMSVC